MPFTTVTQDGDDGMNIVFPVEHFKTVAAIVKPRRRRRLSPEHKAKLLERGRTQWFAAGSNLDNSTLERTQLPFDDPEAQEAIGMRFGTLKQASAVEGRTT
ncbi:MAG: hypothetical protein ACYC3X_04520 [Pirellulaceae bacterium]